MSLFNFRVERPTLLIATEWQLKDDQAYLKLNPNKKGGIQILITTEPNHFYELVLSGQIIIQSTNQLSIQIQSGEKQLIDPDKYQLCGTAKNYFRLVFQAQNQQTTVQLINKKKIDKGTGIIDGETTKEPELVVQFDQLEVNPFQPWIEIKEQKKKTLDFFENWNLLETKSEIDPFFSIDLSPQVPSSLKKFDLEEVAQRKLVDYDLSAIKKKLAPGSSRNLDFLRDWVN